MLLHRSSIPAWRVSLLPILWKLVLIGPKEPLLPPTRQALLSVQKWPIYLDRAMTLRDKPDEWQ